MKYYLPERAEYLRRLAERPRCEGSKTFDMSWSGLAFTATMGYSGMYPDEEYVASDKEFAEFAILTMRDARVLVVDRDQVQALPHADGTEWRQGHSYKALAQIASRLTLPFDVVYLDVGLAGRPDYIEHTPVRIAGFLVFTTGSLLGYDIPGAECLQMRFLPFLAGDVDAEMGVPMGIVGLSEKSGAVMIRGMGKWSAEPNQDLMSEVCSQVERAVAVLQWLESVNVEIVDAPLTRQVRRNAQRKGSQIAQMVQVKLPRSYRAGVTRPGANAIEFDHRFEVRGHYKFFPEATRLAKADPDKLSWVPEREGYFRRIWCPPFVKGPIDKPLIPKTRVLVGPTGDDQEIT